MNGTPIILKPDSPKEQQCLFVSAVQKCLGAGIPFALFSLPGRQEMRLMAARRDDRGRALAFEIDEEGNETLDLNRDCFFIGRFGGDEEYVAGVKDEMSLPEILAEPLPENDPEVLPAEGLITPSCSSTRRLNYRRAFDLIVGRLKREGGKVVLSRLEALEIEGSIIDNFRKLQAAYPDCFRYICFTPSTGVWLGATPELLVETSDGTFLTMALAGTMSADSSEPWSEKNKYEQAIVADTIERRLRELGLRIKREGETDLVVGKIKHILTRFAAKGDAAPLDVLKKLNPTPATLGYPEERAFIDIDLAETHSRYCYAGAVGAVTGGELRAYVNLRCAFARRTQDSDDRIGSKWLYNFYAGGGLTAESDAEEEWLETEMKIDATRSLFLRPVERNQSIDDRLPAPTSDN